MNSKEALEKMLVDLIFYESYFADGGYYDNKDHFDIVKKDLDLLEEYKKIEEEIGIDFITLSKILKQRFVYDNDRVKIELLGLHIKSDELCLYGFVEDTTQAVYLRLKDYGKTWVLDKEKFYKNIK